jgi:uncharacterized membrane protein YbhN (UPF0104 family)
MVAGAIALSLLFSFADIRKVGDAFQRFPPVFIPIIFGLVVAREAVRVFEWHYLLHALRQHTLWRHSLLTLLGGDASQILPAGVYFQNFLLQQAEGTSMTTSLPATLAMQLLEATVSLLVLIAVGVPGWPWMRPVAITVMAGYTTFLVLISRPAVGAWLERKAARPGPGSWVLGQFAHFLEGLEGLMTPGVVLRAGGLTAAYMAFTIATFFAAVRAYALPNIGLPQAAAIYCFVLTLIILVPLPSDLGLSEGSGVAVLLAYGVPLAQGLTIMLIIRFSVLLFTEIIAGGALLFMRQELGHLAGKQVEAISGANSP